MKQQTVDLNTFNDSTLNVRASKVKQTLWYVVNILIFLNRFMIFYGLKRFFLTRFGAQLGRNTVLKPAINVKYPWRLRVGDHCWIGENVWIDNLTTVTIGDNVCISQGAMLLTGNHDYTKSTFDLMTKEIIIEDGAWIGARSVVCPGVRVGTHAVLAVGSVATGDLAPYTIYQGNPAQPVRSRNITG